MLNARKIQVWIENNAEHLSEIIPVKLCPSHEGGMETCWGQEGHIWVNGNHLIVTICHPKGSEVFEGELDETPPSTDDAGFDIRVKED